MLSTGFNTVGFNWQSSPATIELESIVIDWLGKLIELPYYFLFCGGGAWMCFGRYHLLDSSGPVGPLLEVVKEYHMWVHVDVAYGGSAFICPEFRHFLYGVEAGGGLQGLADCFKQAISTFQAMKLWLVLIRSYGSNNLRSFIMKHVQMAKLFEGLVASPLAIFSDQMKESLAAEDAKDVNKKLLEALNRSGKVYMTLAVVGGMYVIRFAVGATLTEYQRVTMVWKVVQEHANSLLGAISSNACHQNGD
ncbi:hypothetical protein LguiA_035495 [Lonicera macranthoides]